MKLRKADKKDFEGYYKLKKEEEIDYSKIIHKKIPSLSKKEYKKDFDKILSSKKNTLIFTEENRFLAGFLYGTTYGNKKEGRGYVEVLFISRKFRRKGIASLLINRFITILKQKGYKRIQLSVNTQNKGAIKLYEKLGFKLHHYELKKEWE